MAYIDTLSEKYGWPKKIKARGFIAYLCDIQPLNEGNPLPIYRFPGGRSLVDECEMVPADPLEVWQVIRCTTNNGERIGIIQEMAHDNTSPVLATVYSQAAAEVKSKELSAQLGIPEYNNDVDVWLE